MAFMCRLQPRSGSERARNRSGKFDLRHATEQPTASGEDAQHDAEHELAGAVVVDGEIAPVRDGQERDRGDDDADDDLGGGTDPGSSDLDADAHPCFASGCFGEPGEEPGQIGGFHP